MLERTCLIASLLLLTSCGSNPPVTVLDIPDFGKNFTQRYKVLDINALTVDQGVEMPLQTVDGEVCMPAEQYLLLKKWILKKTQPVN